MGRPARSETELSEKELRFCEDYLIHLNKARAARSVGAPLENSRQIGYWMYKVPKITAYIQKKLKERSTSAEEIVKMVEDISKSNLSDYYRPVTRYDRSRRKVALIDIISLETERIAQDYIYLERVPDLTEDEREAYMENIKAAERQLLRYEIELERNPSAYKIWDDQVHEVTTMELDMDALVADKEKGKIKKLKISKEGFEVELYSAAEAQDRLLRIHGKYEKDNIRNVNLNIPLMNIDPLSIDGEQIPKLQAVNTQIEEAELIEEENEFDPFIDPYDDL